MDAKLFKGFTPYINTSNDDTPMDRVLGSLSDYEATDPVGSQWRAQGFIRVAVGDDFAIDIQGAGWMCCVQINERNLPGAVLREKMAEKMAKYKEETGRGKLSKKQIMEIKDDVVMELLPQAFIRRKLVPIMFLGKYIVPFSTSAKVCDDVMALLMACAAGVDTVKPTHLSNVIELNIPGVITTIAKDGQSCMANEDLDDIDYFNTTTVGTMRGPSKQTISVKDKDMSSHDVQELLKQDYTVVKLGLEHVHAGDIDPDAGFTLTDKLAFSQLKLVVAPSVRGTSGEDDADTFMATAYLTARTVRDIIDTAVVMFGGLRSEEKLPDGDTDRDVPLSDLMPADLDSFRMPSSTMRIVSVEELDAEDNEL